MPENNIVTSADSTKPSKKSFLVPFVIAGIIVLLLAAFAMMFVAKKVGKSLIEEVIERKTGVETDLDNVEKGELNFTDTKTGQTVSIGGEKLPDTFPKDFPVYQGAKVVSSASGSQQGQGEGFFVTFTTPDGLDNVVPFYEKELAANGWAVVSSFNSDIVQTWEVIKDPMQGGISITSEPNQTTIVVTLSEQK